MSYGMKSFVVTPPSPTSVDCDLAAMVPRQMEQGTPTSSLNKRPVVAMQYPSFSKNASPRTSTPDAGSGSVAPKPTTNTIYGRFVKAMAHRQQRQQQRTHPRVAMRRNSEQIRMRSSSALAYDLSSCQGPTRHSLQPVSCYSPLANGHTRHSNGSPPIEEARSHRTNLRLAATIRELKLNRQSGNRVQEMELIQRMKFILGQQQEQRNAQHSHELTPPQVMVDAARSQQELQESPERIVGRVRTRWESKYFPALQAYLRIHGDMLVPRKYVVPESSSEWPRAAWGVRLGNVVHNLRRGIYKCIDHRDKAQLNEMGFVWQARIRRPRRAIEESSAA